MKKNEKILDVKKLVEPTPRFDENAIKNGVYDFTISTSTDEDNVIHDQLCAGDSLTIRKLENYEEELFKNKDSVLEKIDSSHIGLKVIATFGLIFTMFIFVGAAFNTYRYLFLKILYGFCGFSVFAGYSYYYYKFLKEIKKMIPKELQEKLDEIEQKIENNEQEIEYCIQKQDELSEKRQQQFEDFKKSLKSLRAEIQENYNFNTNLSTKKKTNNNEKKSNIVDINDYDSHRNKPIYVWPDFKDNGNDEDSIDKRRGR